MTLTLILTRHGKSDWSGEEEDFDRMLAPRGIKAAGALGAWLVEEGHLPDTALVSPAVRTIQTFEGIAAGLPSRPEVTYHQPLYHAAPATILDAIRKASGDCLLYVGHNPGIGIAAERLAMEAPDHDQFDAYPTGATTVFRFDVESWAEVREGAGEVVDFVVPREL